jgi:hypothetical protein
MIWRTPITVENAQDDNQKLPFQWMIDNDNAALEKDIIEH